MYRTLLRPRWITPEQLTPEALAHWYAGEDLSLRKALIIQRVLFYHYEGQKAPLIFKDALAPIYAEQGDEFQQYINSAGEPVKAGDLVGFDIQIETDDEYIIQFIPLPDIKRKN